MDRCCNIDIPLWNKTESDVLPQYQLSYGHVIFELQDINILRRKVETFLKLSEQEIEYKLLCVKNFPFCNGNAVLFDHQFDHYIYIETKKYLYLYAKHRLFFDNKLWGGFSKKYREKLAVCTRSTSTEFGYRIIKDGKVLFCGKNDGKEATIFANTSMHISLYMDGQKLFKTESDIPAPVKDDYSMLQFDQYIDQIDENIELISVNSPAALDEGEDYNAVLHTVYRNDRLITKRLFSFWK